MRTLPIRLQKKLPTGARVIYCERRALFEVVEEVSESIYKVLVTERICYVMQDFILGLIEGIASLFVRNAQVSLVGYYIALAVVLILVAQKGIREIINWNLEIYAVTEVEGRGIVHKFWDLNKGISESITEKEPVPSYSQPWYFWLWAFITGEDMYRVYLLSSKHGMYLDGQKISYRFIQAIELMRGTKSPHPEEPGMDTLKEINYAFSQGLINKDEAFNITGKVIARGVSR